MNTSWPRIAYLDLGVKADLGEMTKYLDLFRAPAAADGKKAAEGGGGRFRGRPWLHRPCRTLCSATVPPPPLMLLPPPPPPSSPPLPPLPLLPCSPAGTAPRPPPTPPPSWSSPPAGLPAASNAAGAAGGDLLATT